MLTVQGHVGHVLAIAVCTDGKYLASGGRDNMVFVWDLTSSNLVRTFRVRSCPVACRLYTKDLYVC
jgi:ribosomal RNA-processing protein 9